MQEYTHTTHFPYSASALYQYHDSKGALSRLIPPWENTQIIQRYGGLGEGGKTKLKMHLGKVPYTFSASHLRAVPGTLFEDRQAKGPFHSWHHSHYFSDTDSGSILRDKIKYQLPLSSIIPRKFYNFVNQELLRMFTHRERIINHDLKVHQKYNQHKLNILISGTSGVIGSHLIPFLQTGGHKIWRLVRRRADIDNQEIFWNPAKGVLDYEELPPLDAVIHLAGEYIGLGRWSKGRKKRVAESRRLGTELLAKSVAKMASPPKVFLSSSAIGYYGHRNETEVNETASPGTGYLSQICKIWEEATHPAKQAGLRVITMRIGIGLTPRGGALKQLTAAPIGYVKRFGGGGQYYSWISMDDLIAAILHCLQTEELEGPINICSPNPVTNENMISAMAEITGRPTLPGVSATLLKFLYGEMAKELLLAGCHASPAKLINSGFIFSYPALETTLRSQLGRFR